MPSNPGTCEATILIAKPVMKPLMAGARMNSTIHPSRSSPIPSTMKLQRKAMFVSLKKAARPAFGTGT